LPSLVSGNVSGSRRERWAEPRKR